MSKVIVIGGGAAGIAAARGALDAGADKVDIIERNQYLGGILRQCIHDGFGLGKYGKSMTGPEYAARIIGEIERDKRLCRRTGTSVMAIRGNENGYQVRAQSRKGLQWLRADSVVFATGCREKTRGMVMIPGSRPTGVYTAGLAQKLINIQNLLPGKRVVILGSGDIGLIMARRFHLEGAEVAAVVEIMKDSGGLSRNIRQCLQDFDIPLYTGCTVSKIIGKDRVEAVEICRVNDDFNFIPETARQIECDTLILSVGLIPENEVLISAGACTDEEMKAIKTDEYLQTTLKGIFICGNSRCIHDLVDKVSDEGYYVGRNAAAYADGKELQKIADESAVDTTKGIPPKDDIFCTLCPNGCKIRIVTDADGKIVIQGNKCIKGFQFAGQELKMPMRIVTTTVCDTDGRLIPVRSSEMVSVDKMIEYVKKCRNAVIDNKGENRHNRIEIAGFPAAVVCYDNMRF